MSDPIDFASFKAKRAISEGALERSIGVDIDEYLDVGTSVHGGTSYVFLDNSQHAGFALTPDEAVYLAKRLIELATDCRGKK